MSKKTKALERQLMQSSEENIELKTQLSMLQLELTQRGDELSNTQLELNNAKRKLDDFRSRQETIIASLTEARNARERILKNTRAEANNIIAEAGERRRSILNEAYGFMDKTKEEAENLRADAAKAAEATEAQANEKASALIEKANARAAELLRDADERSAALAEETEARSEKLLADAGSRSAALIEDARARSEKLLEDAKTHSDELIEATELSLSERRKELDALTVLLHEKASLALDQTKAYADLLNLIADEYCIRSLAEAEDSEKSDAEADNADNGAESGSLGEYTGKSDDGTGNKAGKSIAEGADREAEKISPPCGKTEFCCGKYPKPASDTEASSESCIKDAEKYADAEAEIRKEYEGGAVGNDRGGEAHFDNGADSVGSGVLKKRELPADAFPEAPACPGGEIRAEISGEYGSEASGQHKGEAFGAETAADDRIFPDEYSDAASLMKNIYAIEGRELPESLSAGQDGEGDPFDRGGNGGEDFDIPVDPDLDAVLSDLMSILNNK